MAQTIEATKPLQRIFEKNSGEEQYIAYCIAPDKTLDETGWSYKNLVPGNDIFRARVAHEHSVRKAWKVLAPAVATSSMVIADQCDITDPFYLPYGVTILRNPAFPADGVPLNRYEAFSMSAAGCALLMASGGGIVLAVHVSRDGLVGKRSVIDSVADYFLSKGLLPSQVSMRFLFSIDPQDFTHPMNHPKKELAEKNRKLARHLESEYGPGIMTGEEGRLDLPRLFQVRATRRRFGQVGSAKTLVPGGGGFVTTRNNDDNSRNLVMAVRTL